MHSLEIASVALRFSRAARASAVKFISSFWPGLIPLQSDNKNQCPNCSKISSASWRFSRVACALGVKPSSSFCEGSALFSSRIRSVSQAVLRRIDGHAAKDRAVRPFRFLTSRSAFCWSNSCKIRVSFSSAALINGDHPWNFCSML